MGSEVKVRTLVLIGLAVALAACLGEPALPALESVPPATRSAPPADPTVAAAPRISLEIAGEFPDAMQPAPQIRHDLIGRSDCLMCHKQGVGEAPRIPDTHRGLESSTCQTCHRAPAGAALSGTEMYSRVCARCHGENGEGGSGPALNLKSFLGSISDQELRAAIVRGRGPTEMLAWGDLGLLTEQQIDELVVFIRAWEPTAPRQVEEAPGVLPASAASGDASRGQQLFAQFCSGCHGLEGERQMGDHILNSTEFLEGHDDAIIASQIQDGGREMPSFHAILSREDTNDLLAFMRSGFSSKAESMVAPGFAADVAPILTSECTICHGTAGGWSAASYEDVMNSGAHGPAVIPGDADGSLLIQKLRGNAAFGGPMPPGGLLGEELIDTIARWIAAGAPDN